MAALGDHLMQEQQTAPSGAVFPHLWQAKGVGWATEDLIRAQVRSSVARKLMEFVPLPFARPEPALLVGSAPSAKKYIEELKSRQADGAVIYTVNQSHDWLIEAGLMPNYFVAVDPCKGWNGIVTSHPKVTYLIASICDAELFDCVPHEQTILWHAWHDEWVEDELKKIGAPYRMIVHGGSTALMRCLHLAFLMGHRTLHLYGADSSYAENGDWYAQPMRYQQPHAHTMPQEVQVECEGRVFNTKRALISQATDFAKLFDLFGGTCDVRAFGDGLIPHMSDIMNRKKTEIFKEQR